MELEHNVLLNRWLPQLAHKTGRPAATLKAEGLRAGDFSDVGVRIDYGDGSLVQFRWSFWVSDPARPGKVGVFTEHCGYHEFTLSSDDTISTGETAPSTGVSK